MGHELSLSSLQRLSAGFGRIGPPYSDPLESESRLRRHLGMIARPGVPRVDGEAMDASRRARSAGCCPRAGVRGHLEEVENPPRVSGQIAHGFGDGEPARLDEADGEAAQQGHVLWTVA